MWVLRCAQGEDGAEGGDVWTLNAHAGRQTWTYVEDDSTDARAVRAFQDDARATYASTRATERHSGDVFMRAQYDGRRKARGLETWRDVGASRALDASDAEVDADVMREAMRAGIEYYRGIQDDDGHWASDYGGPMFLMPGLIIAAHVMGKTEEILGERRRAEMLRYLENHLNEDGGVGLHIEGHSTMFGTVLTYVAMRLLGKEADAPECVEAREWIVSRGGATQVPSWGKFWLAVLGVYEWHGLNPVPPECWLLPYWLPLHPGRYWCHCRMVYLPMSYLYGIRATGKPSALTEALKKELYAETSYDAIDWNRARNACAKEDLYYPHPWIQDVLWASIMKLEPFLMNSRLRKAACADAMRQIHYEDENTRYIDIGPVNKVFNMLCCWFEDPNSEAVKKHIPRVADYLWVAEDGMKMQGYNGSQLWDCAFSVQAIVATGLADEYSDCLRLAHDYIDKSQVRDDCPDVKKWYRHISKGAWPFSTRDHGWPISDCSSEGLKAALTLAAMDEKKFGKAIPVERLADCVNVILSYQNRGSGGWATYENTRSHKWVEWLNPAETFGDIMIDYPYVECSSASLQALCKFSERYPHIRTKDIAHAKATGRKFLKRIQRADGSWYGSWAVCFTYGTWFGVLGLIATGSTYKTCPALRKAVDFLLSKQQESGGWGESYLSCEKKSYHELLDAEGKPKPHLVNTSWAMLALIASGQASRDARPLHRAARSILRQQCENGDFPQQSIMGVFNANCMISYSCYRSIFPLWALGEYTSKVADA
ncbi:putative cycloartenol synthase [Ostreococcus tauri]|uniref:Terpene cyclase/mutase family member n=1 Tax=Ostreococcus tauri TaxID=70448 RepID=A0A1Y5I9Q9_OSTTA|nr:putative cycloartenol synthase [Ostreococcus tauri]